MKQKYLDTDMSQCHFSTTNPTQTGLELNLGLQGERVATNHLTQFHSPDVSQDNSIK
jgi:hypothetical protein